MFQKHQNTIFNYLVVFFILIIILNLILILSFTRNYVNNHIEYTSNTLLPDLIATANTDLLLKEDFASLRVNLENILLSLQEEGIAYIAVVDLYNEVTVSFKPGLNPDDRTLIMNRLRSLSADFRYRQEYFLNRTRDYVIEINVPLEIEYENFGTIKIGFLKSVFYSDLSYVTRHIIMRFILVLIISGFLVIFINSKIASFFDDTYLNIKKNLTPTIRENILNEFKKKEDEMGSVSISQIPAQKMLMTIKSVDDILALSEYSQIIDELTMLVIKLFQTRELCIYFLSDDNKTLVLSAFYDKDGLNTNYDELKHLTILVGEGDTGKSAQLNTIILSEKPVPGYSISFPLTIYNEVVAVVKLSGKNDGSIYNQSDKALAKLLSSLLGNIIYCKKQ